MRFDDPDISGDRGVGSDIGATYSILTLPGISDLYQHPMGVAVVADSEELCDRALRAIKLEWEERPFILDMEESSKPDAPKIFPEAMPMGFGFGMSNRGSGGGTNIVTMAEREIGDVEKGFAEADSVIEYKINREMNSPAGVEAMVCVARWRNDYLDLWVHHQANPQRNLTSQGMSMAGPWQECPSWETGPDLIRKIRPMPALTGQKSQLNSLTRVHGSGDLPGWLIPISLLNSP